MISSELIPKKMKSLVLKEIGNLSLEELEIPTLKEGEVLVHIKYCGICSSDIERVFINGTYHFPTVPGHEFSGQIVGVYDDRDKDLLGKKASIFPLLPCKKCDACKSEEYAQCSNYNYFGSRCDGGFSEYLAVPKWNLVLFEDMNYDIAALCEPAAVSLHAINRVEIPNNEKVLVLGSGTIGLLIGMILKSKGIEVYIGARREESIKYIESLGLRTINTNNIEEEIRNKTDNKGFKYIFEAIGTNQALEQAILSSSNFAKIVTIGNPKEDLHLEKNIYWKILRKQLTVIGTWNSSYGEKINDWKEILKFMKDNSTSFEKLITNKYSLEEYNEAFNLLRDKDIFKIKVMFEIDR